MFTTHLLIKFYICRLIIFLFSSFSFSDLKKILVLRQHDNEAQFRKPRRGKRKGLTKVWIVWIRSILIFLKRCLLESRWRFSICWISWFQWCCFRSLSLSWFLGWWTKKSTGGEFFFVSKTTFGRSLSWARALIFEKTCLERWDLAPGTCEPLLVGVVVGRKGMKRRRRPRICILQSLVVQGRAGWDLD